MKKILLLSVLSIGVFALWACGPYQLSGSETSVTQNGARDYAERAGGKFLSCSGQDSDGDSYVTCTIQNKSGADEALLCSYKAQGCKPK